MIGYGLPLAEYGFEPDDHEPEKPRCKNCGAFLANRPTITHSRSPRSHACRYFDHCGCKSSCTAEGEDSPRATELVNVEEVTWVCKKCGTVADSLIYEVRSHANPTIDEDLPF